ncbi:MAG: outer membrane protein assembly factor BamD [Phycisphaerales bacterium]
MKARHVMTVGVVGMISAAACAQSPPATEYRLGEQGWTATEAPAPGSDAEIIARARRELAEDRPGVAESILDDYIDRYEKTANPLLPQAYLYRGDAISLGGNEFLALYDYEFVITSFPQSPEYALANERELEIALRYVNGLNRKLLGIRFVGATDIGEELLIRVQERLPGSRLAERAGIELADHYYRNREMGLASEAYDLFLKNHPNSQYRMKAMQRRVYASIGRYKGPRYDSRPLVDAEVLIRTFALQYPAKAEETGLDEALLARIDESGALQLLETARYYFRTGDPSAARYTLKRLIARHPLSAAAQTALAMCEERGWMQPKGEAPAATSPSEGQSSPEPGQ